MPDAADAQPQWISPPGEIVARILALKQIELDDFAETIGLTTRSARGLIEGTTAINQQLAERLAFALGSTPSFWLRCERSYREDARRNFPSYVDSEVKAWLKRLPLREMAKFGWIKLHKDTIAQAEECFRFFG